jgi:signal transduction histidine kinase
LTVMDNGRGFDEERPSSGRLGLGIIRERAAAIDAQLSINSTLGQGTTVKVIWTGKSEAELEA